MNRTDKLNLQQMISQYNIEDNTNNIRDIKHSSLIKKDVEHLIFLKKRFHNLSINDPEEFDSKCINNCNFLFNNYTDIFNKIKKDELNLQIFSKFLSVLKDIEDGKLDQHEGSFEVGKLLKELYVDSALKKSAKLDMINKNNDTSIKKEFKKLSYKDYKKII